MALSQLLPFLKGNKGSKGIIKAVRNNNGGKDEPLFCLGCKAMHIEYLGEPRFKRFKIFE